jgi:hypothetical protein
MYSLFPTAFVGRKGAVVRLTDRPAMKSFSPVAEAGGKTHAPKEDKMRKAVPMARLRRATPGSAIRNMKWVLCGQ